MSDNVEVSAYSLRTSQKSSVVYVLSYLIYIIVDFPITISMVENILYMYLLFSISSKISYEAISGISRQSLLFLSISLYTIEIYYYIKYYLNEF